MNIPQVDHSAVKTGQTFVVLLTLTAIFLDAPALVALVAAVLGIGALFPGAFLFSRTYLHLLKPAGLVRPRVIPDNPDTYRFAFGLGALTLALSFVSLSFGLSVLGWGLAWVVITLASLNIVANVCVGGLVYYQLGRWNVPGVTDRPVVCAPPQVDYERNRPNDDTI
jgi:hypothetical protein